MKDKILNKLNEYYPNDENYNKDLVNELFDLYGVVSSFTFEEVEKLLKTQKTNCRVAAMRYTKDMELLKKISDAPMYDYKKVMNKK